MITIEVLISLLILFMVIATSTVTIKQLKTVREQQINHEELYMLVLNVKDFIDDDICIEKFSMHGDLNGYKYSAKCEKLNDSRSYKKAFEEGDEEGNIGVVSVQFYKILLDIQKKKLERHYLYFKTVTKKVG